MDSPLGRSWFSGSLRQMTNHISNSPFIHSSIHPPAHPSLCWSISLSITHTFVQPSPPVLFVLPPSLLLSFTPFLCLFFPPSLPLSLFPSYCISTYLPTNICNVVINSLFPGVKLNGFGFQL